MSEWPATMLVADDASDEAGNAVDVAIGLARDTGARLSLHLVRDAPCSVLVVRAPGTPAPRRRVASSPRRLQGGDEG